MLSRWGGIIKGTVHLNITTQAMFLCWRRMDGWMDRYIDREREDR